jgi:hypothetical protein
MARDRGTPHTPVAILSDYYSGFAGAPCKPYSWAWFALSHRDLEIYDLVGAYDPLSTPAGYAGLLGHGR